MTQKGRLSLSSTRAYAAEIVDILQYLHAEQVAPFGFAASPHPGAVLPLAWEQRHAASCVSRAAALLLGTCSLLSPAHEASCIDFCWHFLQLLQCIHCTRS